MKLAIIDGHAFVFKAYFAFQTANLTNSITKQPSGAVFGFFKMLFKIITDFKPTHIAVTFDPGTELDRAKYFPAYKAQRKPMPDDLRPQIGEVIEIVKEIGFPTFQINGQEADDIIGTLCKKLGKGKNEILIFSGDKDLYQVLNDNVKMFRGAKGATEFIEIDVKWLQENLGITPEQVTDYMGIVGDSSDNIPGVSGIGEKGAAKLIQEFKSLEKIYSHLEEIKNPSLKEKLIKNKENAFLSKKLATLIFDLDIDVSKDNFIIPEYHSKEKIEIFLKRGYNRLSSDLAKQGGVKLDKIETKEEKPIQVNKTIGRAILVQKEEDLKDLANKLKKQKLISVDTETTSVYAVHADLLGISISFDENIGYYIPVQYSESLFKSNTLSLEIIQKYLKPILEDPKIKKIGQNLKYDLLVLRNHSIELKGIAFDTMLASFILDPESRRHGMDAMAEDLLGYKTITYDELTGTGKKRKPLYEVELEKVSEYAAEDAYITLRLYNILKEKVKDAKVYFEQDLPLLEVLAEMEFTGVKIDTDYFKVLSKDFDSKLKKLEKKIHIHAGREFNIASTQELQKVLFEDIKLPTDKKTKTGYSTDHSVLESLLGTHPIIEDLLEFRKYSKLKSTYVDSLPELINSKSGKIHTNYNQTIAATGRLSSIDPNLQNIPIKDEEGKLLRKGFIPTNSEFELLSLDYSQIELRIMAHYSKDKNMIQAYKDNIDIHKQTAMAIFGVKEKEVTPEMRNKAKIVNFSVIYGATSYGLSQNLKSSKAEAGLFIDKYFTLYPGVKNYMEEICDFCEEKGYVETYSGRKRYIPFIRSTKHQEKEMGKRIAINTPIQGTSADMIKIAMIKIHKKLLAKKSKMIMQVHDELVLEVHKSEKKEVFELAKYEMENALDLSVPILVEGRFGKNWEEAH
jgi:DNA polymerase-1